MIIVLRKTVRAWAFFACLVLSLPLTGQCDPPNQLPTLECEDAPLVCLLNACYETLNIPGTGPNGFCGGMTSIQNPQYFQILTTATEIEIHIHVDNCDNGSSLQSALINDCPWAVANVIDCDPGTGPGGTMVLSATGLGIGETLWIMLDGFSGALCNYTITYTEGIYNPGFSEELETGEAIPGVVCAGYNDLVLVADPPIAFAHGYYWVLGWSGDTITSTLETTTITVPSTVGAGIYEICVRAFSGCDTTENEICFEVEVYEIHEEEKDPEIFCIEEFPFSWGSVLIPGPGGYTQSFTTSEGCTFDSSWMVEQYPLVPLGMLDTLHCEESLLYEGEFYDVAGTYDLFYPGGGLNGCDSMAEITVTLAYLDAFVDIECENGEFVLSVLIQELIPFNAQLEYEWYYGGDLISTDIKLYTLEDGAYDVIVKVITPAGTCEFPLETFIFDEADFKPPAPNMGFIDTLICAQPGVFFEVIVDPFELPFEYTWSGPSNVIIFQDGSSVAEFDFTNAGPSTICVYATNECGDGPETCFTCRYQTCPRGKFYL